MFVVLDNYNNPGMRIFQVSHGDVLLKVARA